MILEIKIEEQDFLTYQLFTASKSDRIQKKKIKGWMLLTIGCVLATIYFYVDQNPAMTVYFAVMTLICGLFYPTYYRWRLKRHYKNI